MPERPPEKRLADSLECGLDPATRLVADGLFTVAEAASFLRLSRSNLYVLMERGELRFVKIGRSRRIPRRAVIALAARGLSGDARVTEVV